MPAPHDDLAYSLSIHARMRMQQRGIPLSHLEQALRHGRTVRVQGGIRFRVLGRKEARRLVNAGLGPVAAEGVHVLLNEQGVVITIYRDQNFWKLREMKRPKPHFH